MDFLWIFWFSMLVFSGASPLTFPPTYMPGSKCLILGDKFIPTFNRTLWWAYKPPLRPSPVWKQWEFIDSVAHLSPPIMTAESLIAATNRSKMSPNMLPLSSRMLSVSSLQASGLFWSPLVHGDLHLVNSSNACSRACDHVSHGGPAIKQWILLSLIGKEASPWNWKAW